MTASEALALLSLPSWPVPHEDEVRRAYKLLAASVHPDVGGTPEAFARAHEAYTVALGAVAGELDAVHMDLRAPRCALCAGRGYTSLTHGARELRIVCGLCGGSGADPG